jgi:hypothetical protein
LLWVTHDPARYRLLPSRVRVLPANDYEWLPEHMHNLLTLYKMSVSEYHRRNPHVEVTAIKMVDDPNAAVVQVRNLRGRDAAGVYAVGTGGMFDFVPTSSASLSTSTTVEVRPKIKREVPLHDLKEIEEAADPFEVDCMCDSWGVEIPDGVRTSLLAKDFPHAPAFLRLREDVREAAWKLLEAASTQQSPPTLVWVYLQILRPLFQKANLVEAAELKNPIMKADEDPPAFAARITNYSTLVDIPWTEPEKAFKFLTGVALNPPSRRCSIKAEENTL